MSSPPPSDSELDDLRKEISERFPGWVFVGLGSGYGDYYLTAERLGTVVDRQYGTTPRLLLQAIREREAQLTSTPTRPTEVHDGPKKHT